MHAKLLLSYLTLCNPIDHAPPDSFVHGILQARILEWVAMPSSRGSSQPRDWTHISCLLHWQVGFLPLVLLGKPYTMVTTKLKCMYILEKGKKVDGYCLFKFLLLLHIIKIEKEKIHIKSILLINLLECVILWFVFGAHL